MIKKISIRSAITAVVLMSALQGCSKTEPCRPGSLFLTIKCTSPSNALDAADVQISSGSTTASYSVPVDCGKEASLEVLIPTFSTGGTVHVSVQGESQGVALGSVVEVDVPLTGKCQARQVELDAAAVGDGSAPHDSSIDSQDGADAGSSCLLGGEGCGCKDGICDDGLQCRGAVCKKGSCGDGIMDPGEMCDDSNNSDSDDCTNRCQIARCGDGAVKSGVEACDDGNAIDTDGCTSQCKLAKCGDGFVQAGEECDTAATDNKGACLQSCKIAKCGDGFVQNGVESCDDGNATDTDGCSNSCKSAACGNGLLEANEQCDDGNTNNSDACLNSCTQAKCGDGFVRQGVEACDDGNGVNSDACTNACKAASCGDGFTQPGEDCDDGNQSDGDLCSNACVSCSKRTGYLLCGQSCLASAQCCPSAVCAAASCSGSSVSSARICSSGGQCPAPNAQACGNYLTCTDATSCKTACTGDGDCVGGRVCQSSTGKCLVRSTVLVPGISGLSGYVTKNAGPATGGVAPLSVGDTDGGDSLRGIISFDLQGVTVPFAAIEKATMTAKLTTVEGTPFSKLGAVRAEHVTFESASDSFNAPSLGNGVLVTNSTQLGDRVLDVTAAVADDYANRNARGGRSQFRFQFPALTDGDSVSDFVFFSNGGGYGPKVVLELTVLSP